MNSPVIVDSGGANIASLQFAFERLGCRAKLSADQNVIEAASHVILPGVGAAANAMARLQRAGLSDLIPTLKQPVLGVCLGMQLLYETSDEGDIQCLGVLPGRVERIAATAGRAVPHMGWNRVSVRRKHALLAGIGDAGFAYFVHSYRAPLGEETLASCDYDEPFAAVVCHRNFFGAQFHPERSGALGSRFLVNFMGLN